MFFPFDLALSALRGAAKGVAEDMGPEEKKRAAEAPPPPPPPPPPPAAPAPPPRIRVRLPNLTKRGHSTAFYVAAGAAATAAVVGVGYVVLRKS